MTSKGRAGAIAYWTLVVVLIAFGTLGLLSIGFPFLLLGHHARDRVAAAT